MIFEPELLPVPRYVADHDGRPRALSAAQRARWLAHLREADILFDFDWLAPERLVLHAPRLRWVQGTSAGIGELLRRTGLIDSDLLFTTAAGVHGSPLAEFVLLGLLYFYRDVPRLQRMQQCASLGALHQPGAGRPARAGGRARRRRPGHRPAPRGAGPGGLGCAAHALGRHPKA